MSDQPSGVNLRDCDDCQKTLKDHLKQCADYGKLPELITKCEALPGGGCSVGIPDNCPAPKVPEPNCDKCQPPKCDVPTITFTCPTSDCGSTGGSAPQDKCPPPKRPSCNTKSAATENDNSCEVKPLKI